MKKKKIDVSRFLKVQRHYAKVEKHIAKQYKVEHKIKVGFVLLFKSVFPTLPIFEKMLCDDCFDAYIIIIPNTSSTYKYQYDLYLDTFNYYHAKYGERVLHGYDIEADNYLEIDNSFSILFFSNPYGVLVNPIHHVNYFLQKDILPIYSSYGFAALKFWDEVIKLDFYNYMWKCTIETQSNLEYLRKVEKIRGINGIVTGYLKMDRLFEVKYIPHERKRILICPHHTVWGDKTLNIGNFLTYAEYFLKLPEMFPNVDFVFRPHPLLLTNLKLHNVWTSAQIDAYMKKLTSFPNMEHDTSADYFEQFVNSDAMIHDCGSFIGEYLYTKKPCCYMLKAPNAMDSQLVPLGKRCMDQHYPALSKDDITAFIRDTVIGGIDPLKEQREQFADTELMVNYPHASDFVLDVIKRELKII